MQIVQEKELNCKDQHNNNDQCGDKAYLLPGYTLDH